MDTLIWGSRDGAKAYDFGTTSDRVKSFGNEIHFTCAVDGQSVNALIQAIHTAVSSSAQGVHTAQAEPTRVTLFIDSPGGSLKDCFKFIDCVNLLRKRGKLHLTTVVTGQAASAGTLMAAVGDVRYVTRFAVAMIHELWSGNMGSYTHLSSGMKLLDHYHQTLVNVYLRANKKITRDELEQMLQKETWFSAEEYVQKGFADEVFMDA